MPRVNRPRRHAAVLAALLAMAGCQGSPVLWQDAVVVGEPPAAGTRLSLANGARPGFVSAPAPAPSGSPLTPVPCPQSGRYAVSDSGTWYAAWWAVRPDSTAALWVARSNDRGASWLAPRLVDSTDAGVTGCRRAAPSVAAWGDYVHVAYSMRGREGPGVFYLHSMDGGRLFHPAAPIAYGDRLGVTSVAAEGDRVVVAYEDPNGGSSRVSLAISATMGHIFGRRIAVSSPNGEATAPQVAIRGNLVAVAWTERSASDTAVGVARMVRTGVIQ